MTTGVYEPGPVTIGDLRREGKALEIGFLNCNRHEYVGAKSIKLPNAYPVFRVAARLRCSRCGLVYREPHGRNGDRRETIKAISRLVVVLICIWEHESPQVDPF